MKSTSKKTSKETIAAKRSAAYRAKKRTTKEGKDKLKAKARASSKKYRKKKKALDEAASAEKSAVHLVLEAILKERRAKSRASSQKHRMKKKAAQGQTTKTVNEMKTAAEKQADYRARKRTTLQGIIELREKSRLYNRKYRQKKNMTEKLVLQALLHDPEVQQPVGDVDVDADERALMNETLHDIEVPDLGPIESFGDFPELDEDAL